MATPTDIATAKVFKNGASQAVRLPKEFRFDTDEVCVKRVGKGLLLFPRKSAWGLMHAAISGDPADDFMPRRNQPRRQQKRKSL